MEIQELGRYKSLLREAFERDFSDEYINLLISNIHYLGWMDGWRNGMMGNSRV